MPLTTDPNDPRLTHGTDDEPGPQAEVYLVLSEAERQAGFVRPVRTDYIHVGAPGSQYPLLDLTEEQRQRYGDRYAKYEAYPESESPKVGKFWTQEELDKIGKGCGVRTVMGKALAETWAANPLFYGATYCMGCQKHLPVGEFVWDADGTRLGS